ncbi:Exocyst complex component 5 [Manis javanica]|nr:Exocyst complex component 5 [Manis javanica]
MESVFWQLNTLLVNIVITVAVGAGLIQKFRDSMARQAQLLESLPVRACAGRACTPRTAELLRPGEPTAGGTAQRTHAAAGNASSSTWSTMNSARRWPWWTARPPSSFSFPSPAHRLPAGTRRPDPARLQAENGPGGQLPDQRPPGCSAFRLRMHRAPVMELVDDPAACALVTPPPSESGQPQSARHMGVRLHAHPHRLPNLVDNAVKIRQGRRNRRAPRPTNTAGWVTVSDQGPGLAPELAQRIFGRFERGHRGTRPAVWPGPWVARPLRACRRRHTGGARGPGRHQLHAHAATRPLPAPRAQDLAGIGLKHGRAKEPTIMRKFATGVASRHMPQSTPALGHKHTPAPERYFHPRRHQPQAPGNGSPADLQRRSAEKATDSEQGPSQDGPGDARVFMLAGLMAEKNPNLTKAEEAFDRCVELAPMWGPGLLERPFIAHVAISSISPLKWRKKGGAHRAPQSAGACGRRGHRAPARENMKWLSCTCAGTGAFFPKDAMLRQHLAADLGELENTPRHSRFGTLWWMNSRNSLSTKWGHQGSNRTRRTRSGPGRYPHPWEKISPRTPHWLTTRHWHGPRLPRIFRWECTAMFDEMAERFDRHLVLGPGHPTAENRCRAIDCSPPGEGLQPAGSGLRYRPAGAVPGSDARLSDRCGQLAQDDRGSCQTRRL